MSDPKRNDEALSNTRHNVKEGWARAGMPNSWPSSLRRHYFRNGISLCRKYWEFQNREQPEILEDPKIRKPAIDCAICTKKLDKENPESEEAKQRIQDRIKRRQEAYEKLRKFEMGGGCISGLA